MLKLLTDLKKGRLKNNIILPAHSILVKKMLRWEPNISKCEQYEVYTGLYNEYT